MLILPSILHRRAAKVIFVAGVAVVILIAAHFAKIMIDHNFEAVVQGEIYRSSQLHVGDLKDLRKSHGIKSVLNLRGENVGAPWYDAELEEAREAGIEHMDFRMKASRELTQQQALKILAIIEEAPKPLLIHCQGGADRSGLVSALILASRGEPAAKAHGQLSLAFGHLPSGGTDAMCISLKSLFPFVSGLES